jgi:DNA repair photolyase
MFCSTTDPYQLYPHPVLEERKRLEDHGRFIMRRALELIRDHSALNVRILTRSPLAREDFDLFKTYGHRLLFGMSVPTLRNDLAKVYEPKAPAPSVRLQTLKQAKDAGIPIFIAMAPTYPECTEEDLHTTLREIAKLNPTTVFHEPINIRAENVERISTHARNVGVHVDSSVFASMETWRAYAIGSLQSVERIAKEEGLTDRQLHLWPDKRLGSAAAVARLNHTERAFRLHWLHSHWDKVSAWPQAIDREPGAPSGDQPFATKCTHRNSVVDLATSRSPDDTYIPV